MRMSAMRLSWDLKVQGGFRPRAARPMPRSPSVDGSGTACGTVDATPMPFTTSASIGLLAQWNPAVTTFESARLLLVPPVRAKE